MVTSSPLALTDVPPEALADMKWAIATLSRLTHGESGRDGYSLYRDYYEGRHRLAFATDNYASVFGTLFRQLAMNLMPAICAAVADRLQVEGFLAEEGAATAATAADDLWKRNQMARRAGEVHIEALLTGDAYAIVWPDEDPTSPTFGLPVIYPNRADQCVVRYDLDAPGRIELAAKVWVAADGRVRLNLYYPDRIEKYVTRGRVYGALPSNVRAFLPLPDDPVVLNPYGVVPVFHFGNDARLGGMGRSELHDVIPVQDALNKTVADLLVGQEFAALPQRYATGLEVEIDSDPTSPTFGKPKAVPFKPGIDRIWTVANDMARFGQFDAADLDKLKNSAVENAAWMSRISGVPMHYFELVAGEVPSGESLRRSEARLIKKVQDRMLAFGSIWVAVMQLALVIANHAADPAKLRLVAEWKDPAPISEREQAETEKLRWETAEIKERLGVPRKTLLVEYGYDETEVEGFAEEKAEESEAEVENARRLFDQAPQVPGANPQQEVAA